MKKLCLVAHERTCEESQVKKKINANSSHRSISYQFAYNVKCIVTKKKIKILLKHLTNKIQHVTIHIRTIMKQIKLLRNEQKCKTSKSRKPCPREKMQ